MNKTILSEVIKAIVEGKNVVLHGPGGVGKSYTISHFVKELTSSGITSIFVTAYTGVAAINLAESGVRASTLNRWAGVKLAKESAGDLAKIVSSDMKAVKRWRSASVLIIDEISMVPAELFDKLDLVGRYIRGNELPFGGIVLLLSGDFLQLPPVKAEFVFRAESWNSLQVKWFELTIPKRYQDQKWFHRLLRFRKGQHTKRDYEFLCSRHEAYNTLLKNKKSENIVLPSILMSKKIDVSSENNSKLEELQGEIVSYATKYTFMEKKGGKFSRPYIESLFEEKIPKLIHLKVGAQVMLKVNLDIDLGLANGSRGVITKIEPIGIEVLWLSGKKSWITHYSWTIEDDDGIYVASQIPLVLAWCVTIHKSQGTTLDYVVVDIGTSIFGEGQAYVALSRVKSGEGLLISGISPKSIFASKVALEYIDHVLESEEFEIIEELVFC
jgi:ATP-dependent DNA helicase PIF1